MQRLLSLFLGFLALNIPSMASAASIDDRINEVMEPITNAIMQVIFFTVPLGEMDVPFVLIGLLAGAIFFTFYYFFAIF